LCQSKLHIIFLSCPISLHYIIKILLYYYTYLKQSSGVESIGGVKEGCIGGGKLEEEGGSGQRQTGGEGLSEGKLGMTNA
jgi:hypothetical protein